MKIKEIKTDAEIITEFENVISELLERQLIGEAEIQNAVNILTVAVYRDAENQLN